MKPITLILSISVLFCSCCSQEYSNPNPDEGVGSGYSLPPVQSVKLQDLNFPQAWQEVIFRNYGYASEDRIAEVLGCDVRTVKKEARRLGLKGIRYDETWSDMGYITLIRNNWHLLPYDQLCTLIGFNEDRLAFVLQEEDFLRVKLGNFKPECSEIRYCALSDDEKAETEDIARLVAGNLPKNPCKPFEFFKDKKVPAVTADGEKLHLIHGYLSPCGDAFAVDGKTYLPDALLARYASYGINGIFIHGLLSNLSPYPFNPEQAKGYEARRERLNELVERCKPFGIDIYLYMNEPRRLCTSRPEVKQYLYDAVLDLAKAVPGLGGILTITMSENLTHCKSNNSFSQDCELCKDIPVEELASEVNNIIHRALVDSGSSARLIANLWGWAPYMGWTDEMTARGVSLLDKDITALCVSEFNLEIEKDGIRNVVGEYSISNPGPSPRSVKTLGDAAATGHKTMAKVQINNSWEISSVPYLSVFDLEEEHLENLRRIGVDEFMLTWTLGGYPSPMLDLVGASGEEGFSLDKWYEKMFGSDAAAVHEAVRHFCDGFRNFPYNGGALYNGPKNLGMANLWSLEPDRKGSTMVCFSFDDYESWVGNYGYDGYTALMEKLLAEWEEGLDILEDVKGDLPEEMYLFSKVAYLTYEADLLHTRYAFYKRDMEKYSEELKGVIDASIDCTKELISLCDTNPAIAYEASNCYFFTSRNLIEKLVQLNRMKDQL